MAGRPVGRGGGLTGLHYGLFTTLGLLLVVLVAFIITLTRVNDAEVRAKRANDQATAYGSPPAYYANEAVARGAPTFQVMNDDVQLMAKLVTGSEEAVGRTVEVDARALLNRVATSHKGAVDPAGSLFGAVTSLEKTLAETKQSNSDLNSKIEELQTENKALAEAIKGAKDEFGEQVAAMSTRIEQIDASKTESLGQKDQQLTDLQAGLDAAQQELNRLRQDTLRDMRDRDVAIARAENQIATLQEQIRAQKRSFDPTQLLTKPDGRILRAIPGSDVVYINLGTADKVKVGMGFAVYSQSREPVRELRGKAAVEVTAVMENTAECRVERVEPGQPILEGDAVVNIAFERGRLPKFLIVGDYDLNYDGIAEPDGQERVRSMVRQWGGQTVDALDETVDFVIIGRAPDVPQLAPGEPVSVIVKALADDKARALSRFKDLIQQALTMYIPVLNQNAFLHLTGYAGEIPLPTE